MWDTAFRNARNTMFQCGCSRIGCDLLPPSARAGALEPSAKTFRQKVTRQKVPAEGYITKIHFLYSYSDRHFLTMYQFLPVVWHRHKPFDVAKVTSQI